MTAQYVAVPFDHEAWDTDVFHDLATNNTRLTIPTGLGGKYRFTGQVALAANATGRRIVTVRKNGAPVGSPFRNDKPALASGDSSLTIDFTDLAVTCHFHEVFVYQDSGANLHTDVATAPVEFGCQFLGA